MKVENMTKAFEVVYNTIGEYELDKVSSKVAGYNVLSKPRKGSTGTAPPVLMMTGQRS